MRYHYRRGVRVFAYGAVVLVMIILLVGALNFVFLLAGTFVYHNVDTNYIYGGSVMDALTYTDNGYVLDEEMERRFKEQDQWAMLLNENGQVVWSIRKPKELKDSYTQADIARMTRYYLESYPVQLRVWEDRIMVTGLQKDVLWKYNLEFPISWMDFLKRVWFYYFLINFVWILALAFFFTKRFIKKREQARIEWIAGVSHDIRTPLSVVMGYAHTLEQDEKLAEEARQQASMICHQSVVMKELIADLNLTSQLEYSMETLRKEKVRPAEMIRNIAAEFLNDFPSEQLVIDVQIVPEGESVCLKADRQLFMRVFRNLINNSRKHSGQDETVRIQISLWVEKNKCCIRLRDNGIGYSEEILRGLRKKKRGTTGNHMHGLEIVKKIILAHGGKIQFGNCEEGGSYCLMMFRLSSFLFHRKACEAHFCSEAGNPNL